MTYRINYKKKYRKEIEAAKNAPRQTVYNRDGEPVAEVKFFVMPEDVYQNVKDEINGNRFGKGEIL